MSVPTIDEMRTELRNAIARNVGHGRRFSVQKVADTLGVSKSLVQKWLAGTKQPCMARGMQLMALFSTPFVNAINGSVGHHGARQTAGKPACALKANEAATKAAAVMGSAIADFRIDRNELALMQAAADEFSNIVHRCQIGSMGRVA